MSALDYIWDAWWILQALGLLWIMYEYCAVMLLASIRTWQGQEAVEAFCEVLRVRYTRRGPGDGS